MYSRHLSATTVKKGPLFLSLNTFQCCSKQHKTNPAMHASCTTNNAQPTFTALQMHMRHVPSRQISLNLMTRDTRNCAMQPKQRVEDGGNANRTDLLIQPLLSLGPFSLGPSPLSRYSLFPELRNKFSLSTLWCPGERSRWREWRLVAAVKQLLTHSVHFHSDPKNLAHFHPALIYPFSPTRD